MWDVRLRLAASTQVLTNTDLLQAIFTLIPKEPAALHSPLVGCTTVCRTFYEPAIRVLWRNLETLVVLWHLLSPSGVAYPFGYRYSGGRDEILLDYLERVNSARLYLDPRRWDRFLWHAARVRRVFHFATSPALCDATHPLIQAVVMQNGGSPILPLLHSIQWLTRVPVRDGALIPLLAPTLRHAIICFTGSDEPAIALLFRRMNESSPFLESLTIHMGIHLDTLGLSPIQELVRFARLREVVISLIQDPSAFRAIVTKPNLSRLDVTIRREEPDPPLVGLQGHAVFVHDLSELTVRGNASVVSDLLKPLRFQALQRAVVHLESRGGLTEIIIFLGLFCTAVSSSDFRSFDLGLAINTRNFQQVGDNEPFLRDLLSPIFPIRGLRSFCLLPDKECAIARLDDVDIRALAAAWPQLERLSIDHGLTSESGVSIDAIHHLYTHCTELRELLIPCLRWPLVGVDNIPVPLDRSSAHPLWHLSMPDSGPELSDEGAGAIARYLLELFPSLDPRRYRLPEDHRASFIAPVVHPGGWRKVVRYIYSIRSARSRLC